MNDLSDSYYFESIEISLNRGEWSDLLNAATTGARLIEDTVDRDSVFVLIQKIDLLVES